MSVVISQDSAEAQERAKWEMFPTVYGPPGRPFKQSEYPKCLYIGGHDNIGRRSIDFGQVMIAGSPQEEAQYRDRGWHVRQEDALEAVERADLAVAQAAAEVNFDLRRRTEKAQREANAVLDAAGEHLGEVPVTPIKRSPGRPRKVTADPSEG